MPDDEANEAENLKAALERRAALIRLAVDRGEVAGKKINELMTGHNGRATLYAEIRRAAEPPPPDKAGATFSSRTSALPFADTLGEPTWRWNPRKLLTQFIVIQLDRDKPEDIQEAVLKLYDVFCLELLTESTPNAQQTGESLFQSLEIAGFSAEHIRQLTALRDLLTLIRSKSARGYREILTDIVNSFSTIVPSFAAVRPGLLWFIRLRSLLRQAEADSKASANKAKQDENTEPGKVLDQAPAPEDKREDQDPHASTSRQRPREPLDWLFDLDLLCQIAKAAERANHVAGKEPAAQSEPLDTQLELVIPQLSEAAELRDVIRDMSPISRSPDAMADNDAAEILVQNQRRMVPDATELLKHSIHSESLAEEIWWRSFDVPPWKPEAVAKFCVGRDRAKWLTSKNLNISRTQEACAGRLLDWAQWKKGADQSPHGTDAGQQPRDKKPTVVVFGAGIAGLTAAHELAERGISVTVVDVARSVDKLPRMATNVGGMARTQWSHVSRWSPATDAKDKLAPNRLFPGEHGYRLFPSFYRHLFDTMKRTPILDVDIDVIWSRHPALKLSVGVSPEQFGVRPTAFDQLQPTHQQVFARRGQFVRLRRDRARSLEAFRTEYMNMHTGLGFPKRDMARFFFKLLRYLMTCSERRAEEYESKSLLTFFDPSLYSDGFIEAIKAAPQALVAMDAERCDARTQGNIYLQLLLDQVLGSEYTDSTLRGPTSEAWFSHWYRYLESLDVTFINAELLALRPKDANNATPLEVVFRTAPGTDARVKDSPAWCLRHAIESARYIVVALDAVSAERVTRTWESAGVPFELRGYTSHVTEELDPRMARYDVVITFNPARSRVAAEDVMHRLLDRIGGAKNDRTAPPRERSAFRNLRRATGQVPIPPGEVDEIQIALWFANAVGRSELRAIEQALERLLRSDHSEDVRLLSEQPTWINTRSTVTTPRMPDDVYGEHPTDRFQTFAGVQYYFEHDFKLVRGHVYLPDTEWGLSAVSQGQFWPRRAIPDPASGIRGVLSIDIGNCNRKSSYNHRTVMDCTREQLAREVWRQFTDSLRSTRGPTSIVTNLPLPEPLAYHIDDNLVFTSDKGSLRANRTPFLINNAGDWDRRPRCEPWVPGRQVVLDAPRSDATDVWQAPHGGYRIHADKVVFCGTYMRTFTRMTTMEAANESARHAVNAILDHMAARGKEGDRHPIAGDYCDIWDPEEHELDDLDFFKRIDKLLFEAKKPHIADILQFDKIADLQYPEPSPIQALMAALGSTVKSDWGISSTELVTSLDGLLNSAKQVVGGIAGATGEHPLLKLLGSLGIGKTKPQKGS